MKPKLKTRLGWAWPAHLRSPRPFLVLNNKLAARGCEEMVRVATIDVSDPEALVAIVARAHWKAIYGPKSFRIVNGINPPQDYYDKARIILTALGILPKKRQGAK